MAWHNVSRNREEVFRYPVWGRCTEEANEADLDRRAPPNTRCSPPNRRGTHPTGRKTGFYPHAGELGFPQPHSPVFFCYSKIAHVLRN